MQKNLCCVLCKPGSPYLKTFLDPPLHQSSKVLVVHSAIEVRSQHYEALQMFVIGIDNKPMKMPKKGDGFLAAICPKYEIQAEF